MKKFALITILLLTSCAKDSVNYESSLVFTDDIYYEKETDLMNCIAEKLS